ncbi:MAG: hypothetical protein QNK20_05745 [Aureibaculum sp.]|nr:hypothetical protein [Aureibaculum sp.]
MNYRTFLGKIRPIYLLHIIFILLILGFKLSNYLFENDEYSEYTNLEYSEVVFSEQANGEPFLTNHSFFFNYSFDNVCEPDLLYSYKNDILLYNRSILIKFKNLISAHVSTSNIISILQSNNIWHKSLDEEPSTFS